LGNLLGISWEQGKNLKFSFSPLIGCPKWIQQFTGAALLPPGWVEAQTANHLPPKRKILGPSRMHVDPSQWLHENLIPKLFVTIFSLG
jgi:hypothetical protein